MVAKDLKSRALEEIKERRVKEIEAELEGLEPILSKIDIGEVVEVIREYRESR